MACKQPNGYVYFPPRKVKKREWGEERILVENEFYTMKEIYMKPNAAGGLQYHHKKFESGTVKFGSAIIEYDKDDGHLTQAKVGPGDTFHIPQGAVHRIIAGPNMPFCYIEASTPHDNDRCHVEKEYGFEEETGGLPSTRPEDVVTTPKGADLIKWAIYCDTSE